MFSLIDASDHQLRSVIEIWSSKVYTIERDTFMLCAGVKYYPNLIRFFWVIDSALFSFWYQSCTFCMIIVGQFLHEGYELFFHIWLPF